MTRKKATPGRKPYGRPSKAQPHPPSDAQRNKAILSQIFGKQIPRPISVDHVPLGVAALGTDPITAHLRARIRSAPQPATDAELQSFLQDRPVGISQEHVTDEHLAELAPLLGEAAALAHKRGISAATFTQWRVWALVEALRELVFGTVHLLPEVTAREDQRILASLAAAASLAHKRELCPGVFAELASYAWMQRPR